MKEIDVTLTDYGLTILCFVIALVIFKKRTDNPMLTTWFTVLFLSVGFAAFIGGTVHGFVYEGTLSHFILWRGAILFIGVSALCGWMIGFSIIFTPFFQKIFSVAAIVNFIIYSAYVLFFNQNFGVAPANYLPSAVFLLIVFISVYKQTLHKLAFFALLGLVLTFVAAGIQQLEIDVHPDYFNHNAFYHVVQAAGLYLIFLGSTFLIKFEAHHLKD